MEHDPTDVALLDVKRAEAEEKARIATQTEIGDLKWVLRDKRGRRFVFGLLERAGVFRLSYVPNSFDATSFNEGRRNEGLRTLAMLQEHAPANYAQMLSEHDDRRNDRDPSR